MTPDLGSTSVFLDYDGTISVADTGVHILDRLVGDAWHGVEAEYESGAIGSRQCMVRQWALLPSHDEGLLRSVAAEVALDPAFGALVAGLLGAGAEVTIVSDGFGFYIDEVAGAAGVAVKTAAVDWNTGDLVFPYADPDCSCARCGTCKPAVLRQANERGRRTVFVGDGTSDRLAAPLADVLFATAGLARWCDDNAVAYRPFSTLADVAAALGLSANDSDDRSNSR